MRIDADASLGRRYCLPDSSSLHGYSPETASRVTLAMLGIGFQPNLPSIQLNHKTTNQSGTQYQASDNPGKSQRPTGAYKSK